MKAGESLINRCIVCLCGNEELERLYVGKNFALSDSGELYAECFGLQLDGVIALHFPHYLCQNCELQMRLFQKLKAKAYKNFQALQKHFSNVKSQKANKNTNKSVNIKESKIITNDNEKEDQMFCQMEFPFVQLDSADGEERVFEFVQIESSSDIEQQIAKKDLNNKCVDDAYMNNQCLDDGQYQCAEEIKKQPDSVEKNLLQCRACKISFKERQQLVAHRKEVHFNKYPCHICSKLLQSPDGLKVHMRLHFDEPSYKCILCPKTFHQKGHYQYHMNKHNNVRNFKCTQCKKAFLTKSDLSIHIRLSHKGDRPYTCKACGKTYLLHQHLKMHSYSHLVDNTCVCPQCEQKFKTPATLRTHILSIHAKEPEFQCEYCGKKFRRKHHLVAHHKVHIKCKSQDDASIAAEPDLQSQIKVEDDDFMSFVEIVDIPRNNNLT